MRSCIRCKMPDGYRELGLTLLERICSLIRLVSGAARRSCRIGRGEVAVHVRRWVPEAIDGGLGGLAQQRAFSFGKAFSMD